VTSFSRFCCLAIGILAFAGCGSDESENNQNESDAGSDSMNDDVQADSPVGDDAKPDTGDSSCTPVNSVSGSVINEQGDAFSNVGVVLCVYQDDGSAKCLNPVKTSASGEFSVTIPAGDGCLESAAYQLKADALSVIPLYCPVDVAAGGAIAMANPNRLVDTPACTRDALGEESKPHEVSAPDDMKMTVIPNGIWLFDFSYDDLGIRRWDAATWGWPCFIDAANAPDDLAVFAPELEVKSDAKDAVHISFPNEAGLSAGTVVDLYGLGGAATSMWDGKEVHEGSWQVIGEAQVSADGSRIETRPGQGLPFATWIGWKKK